MSSGLRIRAPLDPDFDPQGPYPDHLYLYTGGVDSYHYAATRPQQWTTSPSRSAPSSTSSASAPWSWRPTPSGTS